MTDYHVWADNDITQYRWYGGAGVNVYTEFDGEWIETDVWSHSDWWAIKPTLAQVDAAVREHVEGVR